MTLAWRATPLRGAEIPLSPDEEARLRQFAGRTGRNAAQVIGAAFDHMLECKESFLVAVENGRASAGRTDLLEHYEVVERIEQMILS